MRRTAETSFDFLEAYLERMEGAIAVQVWSALLGFTRDVLSNQTSNRALVFPTLRCVVLPLTVFGLHGEYELTVTPRPQALHDLVREDLADERARGPPPAS